MKEYWKKIPEYEKYEVSNLGRLRRKYSDNTIKYKNIGTHKYLKTFEGIRGYALCFLYGDSGRTTKYFHRVIAELFIDNPKNKPEVNHKNGIKNDNRIENLEWVDRRENQLHAINTGLLILRGGDPPKLNYKKAQEIRKLYKEGRNKSSLARQYSVSRSSISKIIDYKSYK